MTIYKTLDSLQKEIRVLILEPGTQTDALRCHLQTVRLQEAPKYEALSYVWGSRDNMPILLVDSEKVHVTENLYAALKRLRSPGHERTLWVDAICINQTDAAEKSAQISMMSEIYRSTWRCLIWLGEEPETPVPTVDKKQNDEVEKLLMESEQLLQNLSSILPTLEDGDPLYSQFQALSNPEPSKNLIKEDTFRITQTNPAIWYGDDRDTHTVELRHLADMENDSIFQAFCLFRLLFEDRHLCDIDYFQPESHLKIALRAAHWLASRDWWTRVWTVQECILPPSCTVIYGSVEMPWSILLTGMSNFQRHRTTCCSSVPGIHDILNFHMDIIPVIEELRAQQNGGAPVSLELLMREFRYRAATEPKDKVYALIPLVTDWNNQPPLVPDCAKSTSPEQVYALAIRHMIESSGSLTPLCQQMGPNREPTNTFPSWVPDFSKPYSLGGTLDHYTRQLPLYRACRDINASFRTIGSDILALEGIRIDSIRRASTALMELQHGAQVSVFAHWYDVAEEECKETNPYWRDCFWQTLCGDTIMCEYSTRSHQFQKSQSARAIRRATDEDKATFKAWCIANDHLRLQLSDNEDRSKISQHDASSTVPPEAIGAMNHAIRITTRDRRFIISKSGRMGIAPKMAVLTFPTADEIFIVAGGVAPFVLRPAGTRDIPGVGARPCYEIIGDCYLHGVMDGEAMRDYEAVKETIYIV